MIIYRAYYGFYCSPCDVDVCKMLHASPSCKVVLVPSRAPYGRMFVALFALCLSKLSIERGRHPGCNLNFTGNSYTFCARYIGVDMPPTPLDTVINKICQTEESRKLAKAYFKHIRSLRPGEGTHNLPEGVVHICAWMATTRYD